MMFPPSLPDYVKARAFRATNGELGIMPGDAGAFLDACRSDGVEVLGWELWIVDHFVGLEKQRRFVGPRTLVRRHTRSRRTIA
jgi:hypothetical protein